MTNTENYFTHPQEIWDNKKCAKVASNNPPDHWGNRGYKGKVADSGSTHAQYGQKVEYNGGFIAPDGEWYKGEIRPLPQIPDNYEFFKIPTWGTYIRKKA